MDHKAALTMIPGVEDVTRWFGEWPSFHDAEVVSLLLMRKGESVLRLYPYYPERPATVEFIFEELTDVELAEFSHQNLIFDLHVGRASDRHGEEMFRVALSPCFGIAGEIFARSLRVVVAPGKSPDGVSA